MIGTTVAHYEVVELLGKGGMGEVYRAHDTKLERDVALKVLPPDVAGDPERMARFEREAKVLASLSHGNIATLHGIETAEDAHLRFLVMELVEGEDLADRLVRGPLAVEDAVDVARQVAQALEAAHASGVVHRDLKPANIKLTPDGGVKVLDFGLARAYLGDAADASGEVFSSPTITAAMTQVGTILGTAAYMSPEQAKGRTVDARADLWSLGVILVEMLTGRRLFEHETVGETLAAVLRADIDWDDLPADTPPSVRRMLRRCLERDPRRRLRAAGDAWLELEETGTADDGVPASQPVRWWRSGWLAAAVATAIAAGAVAAWRLSPVESSSDRGTLHVSLALPDGTQVASADSMPLGVPQPVVAISPDGSVIACVVETGDGLRLFRRRLDRPSGEVIPGSEGAFNPRFSPDGRWIAFMTGNRLKRVRADGDRVLEIREVTNAFGLAWDGTGHIVVAANEGTELQRIDVETGAAENLASDLGDTRYSWPSALRDGNGVVVNDDLAPSSAGPGLVPIVLHWFDGRPRAAVGAGGTMPRILATGHLAAVRDGGLTVAEFDPSRPESVGRQITVLEGVLVERDTGQLDVSSDGDLVYVPGGWHRGTELVWVDGNGVIEVLPFPALEHGDFELSPDGTRLAVTVVDSTFKVWIYDLERGTRRLLTTEGDGRLVTWSPDGRAVAFWSNRTGTNAPYVRVVGSSEPATPLDDAGNQVAPYAWPEPDRLFASTYGRLVVLDPTGGREPEVVVDTPAAEWGPDVSPDGRWLAYTSDESGRYEVYVRSLADGDRSWTVSLNGGEEPIFSADGDFLFFRNGNRFYRTPILEASDDGSRFVAGRPEVFVEGPYGNVSGLSYDVSPDGRRLLLLRAEGGTERPSHLNVVLDWFPSMRRTLADEGVSRAD